MLGESLQGSSQACRMQAAGLVDRIIREHADDIMDSDKAVRRVEAERHSQLASAKVRPSALLMHLLVKPCQLHALHM